MAEAGGGGPAEGAVGPAVGHDHAGRVHGHADPVRLVVDGDHPKVGLEFVLQALLGANQPSVHHQACRGQQRRSEGGASDGLLPTQPTGALGTCSRVRHQVEDVSRLGVDVEADVHVASGEVHDEVGIVVH